MSRLTISMPEDIIAKLRELAADKPMPVSTLLAVMVQDAHKARWPEKHKPEKLTAYETRKRREARERRAEPRYPIGYSNYHPQNPANGMPVMSSVDWHVNREGQLQWGTWMYGYIVDPDWERGPVVSQEEVTEFLKTYDDADWDTCRHIRTGLTSIYLNGRLRDLEIAIDGRLQPEWERRCREAGMDYPTMEEIEAAPHADEVCEWVPDPDRPGTKVRVLKPEYRK